MLNNLDLKYRFGFLITTQKDRFKASLFDAFTRWNIVECGFGAFAYHYEAKLSQFNYEKHIVYCFGDIFVAHSDMELCEILRQFTEQDNWDAIDNLSGRFAILVYDKYNKNFNKIFSDPIGSRTIFYSNVENGLIASHSSLLAEVVGIERSDKILAFTKTPEFLSITTKFLPADLTMYEGVYGMPSNHYYCFKRRKTVRFWPRKTIESSDLDSLLHLSEEYLHNFINYFISSGIRPVIGLTGGVDCRVLVAAWNNKKIHFKCLTWDRSLSDHELSIVEQISSYTNADLYVLNPKKKLNGDYYDALKFYGHLNRGEVFSGASLTAQTAEFVDPSNAFIRGLGGEILRGMFNKVNSKRSDLDDFSYAINLYKTRKVINTSNEFSSFLNNAYAGFFDRIDHKSETIYNYDFGDLIYWEQRMSMWAASLLNEGDPALKNFAGLNSRRMYETSYGLDPLERFNSSLLLKITGVFDSHLMKLPTA